MLPYWVQRHGDKAIYFLIFRCLIFEDTNLVCVCVIQLCFMSIQYNIIFLSIYTTIQTHHTRFTDNRLVLVCYYYYSTATILQTHIFKNIYYRKTIIICTGLTGNGNDPKVSPGHKYCYFVNRSCVCFVGRQNKTVVDRCCCCSVILVYNNTT